MVNQSHYTVNHEGDSYDFYGMEKESYWFPITLRNSVFVTLYGFFEHILIKICNTLYTMRGISMSVESFFNNKQNTGSTIVKASNYILNVATTYFPDQLPEWTHMKNCAVLRNSIVHNFAKNNDRVKLLLPMSGITTEIKDITNEVLDFDYMGEAHGVSQLNFENSFFLLSSFSKEFLNSFATLMNKFFLVNASLLDGKHDEKLASFNFTV